MDTKKPDSDPASRWRTLSLILTIACALMAAAVLVLLLRVPSMLPGPPPPASAAASGSAQEIEEPEVAPSGSSSRGRVEIVVDPGMVRIDGRMKLRVQTVVYREARKGAEVIADLPQDTDVELVGRRSEWTLIAWANGGSAVWMGWVVFPAPAAPSVSASSGAAGAGNAAMEGRATLQGVVSFSGKVPEMKVPLKRKDAEICKLKEIRHNAVLVKDGKLRDVLVRIAPGSIPGAWKAPEKHAVVDQVDCVYLPRIQGVMAGQVLDIRNGDLTLHNAHLYKGSQSFSNQAQPKGAEAISKETPDEPSFLGLTCDVHPWMRSFVVVTDHPFFAVSGDDGSFQIEKVPAGRYTVQAWHSQYGLLEKTGVVVRDTGEVTVDFTYTGNEPEPPENKGELSGLF